VIRPALFAVVAALALVAGCDGPKEDAGEKADANAGVVSSEDTIAKGPAERVGEAQDQADASRNAAIEARADAAEDDADAVRAEADRKADALEEQARQVRERAEQKADAEEDRADAIRNR
jgi:hypothetical protein